MYALKVLLNPQCDVTICMHPITAPGHCQYYACIPSMALSYSPGREQAHHGGCRETHQGKGAM